MFGETLILGRLTRDPELKTRGEKSVCDFAVAVDDGWGESKTTSFYNCSAWNRLGENVEKYCKKGSIVLVRGKMKMSKKEAATYWNLIADDVVFVPTGEKQENPRSAHPNNNRPNRNQPPTNHREFDTHIDITDDDLPF